jgi:hypothetical protein
VNVTAKLTVKFCEFYDPIDRKIRQESTRSTSSVYKYTDCDAS